MGTYRITGLQWVVWAKNLRRGRTIVSKLLHLDMMIVSKIK